MKGTKILRILFDACNSIMYLDELDVTFRFGHPEIHLKTVKFNKVMLNRPSYHSTMNLWDKCRLHLLLCARSL